jgi:hypothetical protein
LEILGSRVTVIRVSGRDFLTRNSIRGGYT